MAEIAPDESRSLFELVLESLADGIDKDHARGLKIVTRWARDFAER